MGFECEHCERDIFDHEPVFVAEFDDGIRSEGMYFCNYACLAAFLDAEAMADGTSCDVNS